MTSPKLFQRDGDLDTIGSLSCVQVNIGLFRSHCSSRTNTVKAATTDTALLESYIKASRSMGPCHFICAPFVSDDELFAGPAHSSKSSSSSKDARSLRTNLNF